MWIRAFILSFMVWALSSADPIFAKSNLTSKTLTVATDNFTYSAGFAGAGQPTPTVELDIRGGLRYSGTFYMSNSVGTPNIFSHKLFYARAAGTLDSETMVFDVHQSRYGTTTNPEVTLFILDDQGDLVSATGYAIQASAGQQTNLANAINGMTNSQVGVLVSNGNINASGQSDIDTMSIEQGLYAFNRLYRTGQSTTSYASIFRGSTSARSSAAHEALSAVQSTSVPVEFTGWFIQDTYATTSIPGPHLWEPSEGTPIDSISFQANDASSQYMKINRADIVSNYVLSIEGPMQVFEDAALTNGAEFALRASKDATEESYFRQYDGTGPAHSNSYMWWGIADNWDTSATDKDFVVMADIHGGTLSPAVRFEGDGTCRFKVSYNSGGADYAEWVAAEESVPETSLVGLNLETGLARKYRPGDAYLGPVSSDPGFVGNDDFFLEADREDHVLLALMGQVVINPDEVRIEGRKVSTLDGIYVGILLADGRVLIGK